LTSGDELPKLGRSKLIVAPISLVSAWRAMSPLALDDMPRAARRSGRGSTCMVAASMCTFY
jgi:hypothetical protein